VSEGNIISDLNSLTDAKIMKQINIQADPVKKISKTDELLGSSEY
jgi:hypothetical protein